MQWMIQRALIQSLGQVVQIAFSLNNYTFTAIITFSSLLSSWAIWITCVRIRFPLSLSVNSLATTLIEFPAYSLSLFYWWHHTSKLLDLSNSCNAFTTWVLISSWLLGLVFKSVQIYSNWVMKCFLISSASSNYWI